MSSEFEDSEFSDSFWDSDDDNCDTVSLDSVVTMGYSKRLAEKLERELDARNDEITSLRAEIERLKKSELSARQQSKARRQAIKDDYAKGVKERKVLEKCCEEVKAITVQTQKCLEDDIVTLRNMKTSLASIPNIGSVVAVLRDTDKRISLTDRAKNINGRLGRTVCSLVKTVKSASKIAEQNLAKAIGNGKTFAAESNLRKLQPFARLAEETKPKTRIEIMYQYKTAVFLEYGLSDYLAGVHQAMVAQAHANGTDHIGDYHENQWLNRARTQVNPHHPYGLGWRVAKHALYNETYCEDRSTAFYGAHMDPNHSLSMHYPYSGRVCRHGYWAGIQACIAYMREQHGLGSILVKRTSRRGKYRPV